MTCLQVILRCLASDSKPLICRFKIDQLLFCRWCGSGGPAPMSFFASAEAFAVVGCVGEDISTFHPLEFLLRQVKAVRQVALIFGIAHQELAFFSFLDG